MRDEFVPLAELLRPSPSAPQSAGECTPDAVPAVEDRDDDAVFEAASAIRLFRAALHDAFDAVRERLLRDIACDVLGRELAIADADVEAIASRACAQLDVPVSVRVHPADAGAFDGWTCQVEPDERLHRGDVLFRVSEGSIDASLGVRLEGVLDSLACG